MCLCLWFCLRLRLRMCLGLRLRLRLRLCLGLRLRLRLDLAGLALAYLGSGFHGANRNAEEDEAVRPTVAGALLD